MPQLARVAVSEGAYLASRQGAKPACRAAVCAWQAGSQEKQLKCSLAQTCLPHHGSERPQAGAQSRSGRRRGLKRESDNIRTHLHAWTAAAKSTTLVRSTLSLSRMMT